MGLHQPGGGDLQGETEGSIKWRLTYNSQLPSLDQEIDIMVTQMQIQKGKMFDNMEGER